MPLQKLQFRPGIVRETTEYSQSGGWYDADKVRFRAGFAEKIGGWQAVVKEPMGGVCRHIHQWSNLETDRYVALGTSSHLYILWSNNYYDITPTRAVFTAPLNPFYTMNPTGSLDVGVFLPGHGAHAGDHINVSGASTPVDVYQPAELNGDHRISYIIDADFFAFTLSHPNTAGSVSGGGPSVEITFLIGSGLDDAVVGQGWGASPWSGTAPGSSMTSAWGEGFDATALNPLDPTVNQLRLWDLDNFGEDLVANIRGGPIYYWHQAAGLATRALPLNQAVTVGGTTFTPVEVPLTARQILVSPNDRHLIAMGCEDIGSSNPDLLLVRWSTEEDAYNWQPLRTNSAGSQRLSAGSYIICGMRTRQEILIWTDLGLWTMRYIGAPYVFGFEQIAAGLSIIGPNAMINAGSNVMWMDRGIFYAYTGQNQELPCPLKDYVFGDFNYLQGYKVYAGHNHTFSEVIWFYPSANSVENDRYVIYNYSEQIWTKGMLERTAWLDMGRASFPIAADRVNSLLYYHEYGDDANGAAMPAYIDSADIDADGGEHFLFLSRLIPDVIFRGQAELQSAGLTIFTRPAPGKPKEVAARIQVTPYSDMETIRVRGRQISFRLESNEKGVGWRLGTLRADMQPDEGEDEQSNPPELTAAAA